MRLAFALSVLLPTLAHAAPSAIPTEIAARIEEDKKFCAPQPASIKAGFLTRKDVNGDGIPDYILDYHHLLCGDTPGFCGSGGCTTVIYASHGRTYVKALDDLVQGYEFKKIGGRPVIVLGLHGSACGKMGAAPCGTTLYWNGEKFSPAH